MAFETSIFDSNKLTTGEYFLREFPWVYMGFIIYIYMGFTITCFYYRLSWQSVHVWLHPVFILLYNISIVCIFTVFFWSIHSCYLSICSFYLCISSISFAYLPFLFVYLTFFVYIYIYSIIFCLFSVLFVYSTFFVHTYIHCYFCLFSVYILVS